MKNLIRMFTQSDKILKNLYRKEKISKSVKKFYRDYGVSRKVPVYEYGVLQGYMLMNRRKIGPVYKGGEK